MDKHLEREQDIQSLPFGVVLIEARSNRVQDLLPLVPGVLTALDRIHAGRLVRVRA